VVLIVVCARVALKPRSHSVVPIFSNAGQNWLAGRPLYGLLSPDLDQFRYTPAVAAAFAPWSLLPVAIGEALWRSLNVGAFFAGLAAWCRWTWGRPEHFGVALGLCLPLAVGGLNNGQCNLLVAGLLLGATAAFVRERWTAAAAGLTAAALLKGYPLALGLLLGLVEPRRFAGRLAACVAVGLALPFVCQRPDYAAAQYAGFLDHLRHDDRTQMAIASGYRDFQMLLRAWGFPLALSAYRLVEVAGGAACAALVLYVRRRSGRTEAIRASGSLGLCWMTLFGPATESCTYVLIAPILAAAVIEARDRASVHRSLAFGSYTAFTLSMAAAWLPRAVNFAVQSSGLQPAAAALLTAAVVLDCTRFCRRDGRFVTEPSLARAA
jgi:hypothetical protein